MTYAAKKKRIIGNLMDARVTIEDTLKETVAVGREEWSDFLQEIRRLVEAHERLLQRVQGMESENAELKETLQRAQEELRSTNHL